MKRIILFSTPYHNENLRKIMNLIFPSDIKDKRPVFMPSQGVPNTLQKYLDDWKGFAHEYNLEIEYIDNSLIDATFEREKLMKSNILIISGGDTFQLLINLRKSGFDKAITQFTKKEEFILAGYSAGAYVLTPTLEAAKIFNENYPGGKKYTTQDKLRDFKALGIVDFEIIAHYSKNMHEEIFKNYIKNNKRAVKPLADNEFVIIDL
jgi:dipeptidase E